jgi:molybdate/tungstate transport system substrate-binding protein
MPTPRFALVLLLLAGAGACASTGDERGDRRLIVFNAGSLARPLRTALDTFATRHDIAIEQESAGSLETARKITELGKIPDVVALADVAIFPQLLVPAHADWHARFARNRMVIAYTDGSRYASEVDGGNWWQVLQRPDVEVGRADPDLDPNGYRTLLVLQLAEQHYGDTGLAGRLLARAPSRNVRPKETDLLGLLQAGELDYIWSYESMAQAASLRYVRLPSSIDLGDPAQAQAYARASVRVVGSTPGDTIEFRGEPIVYGLSIPREAPHPELARRFVTWLLSDEGRSVLERARLDALEQPEFVGTPAVSTPDSLP